MYLGAPAYLDLNSFLSSLQLNLCLFFSASQANNMGISTALVLLLRKEMPIEELVFFY